MTAEPDAESAAESTGRADGLQSLTRGLSVIRCFDADHRQLSLSDVARRADLTRATARRILHTLEGLGYVRARDGRFSLTPRVLELGSAYLSSSSLAQIAQPHLEDLTAASDESSSVSELDGDDIVYVARAARRRIMTVSIGIGTRFPAYATSMGRVLLAGSDEAWLTAYFSRVALVPLTPRTIVDVAALRSELRQVKKRGWCLVDEELEAGLRSIAAPILGSAGLVVAAANVSATTRTPISQIRAQILPALLACTRAIGEDLTAIGARGG